MSRLRGAIFDLDGTLVDSRLDFNAIRQEIGGVEGPLLEEMEQMAPPERQRAIEILNRHEVDGASRATAFPGVPEFLGYLATRGVRIGVLTRNCHQCAVVSLERCGLAVDTIVSRDHGPVKPEPDGVLAICGQWGLEPRQVMMVGDYKFDIEAGRRAGCMTALVTHGRDLDYAGQADICFAHFGQAIDALGPCFDGSGPWPRCRWPTSPATSSGPRSACWASASASRWPSCCRAWRTA